LGKTEMRHRAPRNRYLLVKVRPARAELEAKSMTILKWALIFLVVSIIAGLLGFTGISAASADIARFLFYIFVVIFLVLLILGLTIFRA
jgi:uncharacterized membrane protein YtjA (UPF0391 family)